MAFDYNHVPSFIAAIKEEKPFSTFLKDRYFPNGQNFTTDEVLVEYKKETKTCTICSTKSWWGNNET